MLTSNSKPIQLTPNCLLTRFPLILIGERSRSLDDLSTYLIEHGYIVRTIYDDLSPDFKKNILGERIKRSVQGFAGAHFLFNESSEIELNLPRSFYFTKTVLKSQANTPNAFYLKLAIHLAENDLKLGI